LRGQEVAARSLGEAFPLFPGGGGLGLVKDEAAVVGLVELGVLLSALTWARGAGL
jgi:hypothetical protein